MTVCSIEQIIMDCSPNILLFEMLNSVCHAMCLCVEKLQTRKKSSIELSKSVNETKKQIDQLRTQVEEKSRKRLETTGDLVTDNGEVVMDEEEYTAIVELKKVMKMSVYSVLIIVCV